MNQRRSDLDSWIAFQRGVVDFNHVDFNRKLVAMARQPVKRSPVNRVVLDKAQAALASAERGLRELLMERDRTKVGTKCDRNLPIGASTAPTPGIAEVCASLAKEAMSAIDPATIHPLGTQIGGAHYKGCAIQPVEFSERNGLSFLEGCVVKRVVRHSRGGKGREDIKKAIHELQLILELHYPTKPLPETTNEC